VRPQPSEIRDFVVVGHLVRVICCAEDNWLVTVDGREVEPACTDPHAAWARGVAESYRQGSKARRPARFEADHEPGDRAVPTSHPA